MTPQLGLRRRRRVVNEENLNNDNHNNNNGDATNGQGEEEPPPHRILRRPQRAPPPDTGMASWKVSHVYCLVSTFLAVLAILAASPPLETTSVATVANKGNNKSNINSASQSWTSVEQVAKAAAVGMAAKRGAAADLETRDLLQSIQQWWNSQKDKNEPTQFDSSRKAESQRWLRWSRSSFSSKSLPSSSSTREPPSKVSTTQSSTPPKILQWIDPAILSPSPTTPTDIIDKILTSTPRLLAIANFLLAMTYLVHSFVAAWFLGPYQQSSAHGLVVDWSTSTGPREKMGGFLVFKLLLISAVVAPDTLDLLILLTWYTLLTCLRSLDHLAHATTTHLSYLGHPPRPGVVHLLSLVLVCNILAAASCVALFHAAGWGMVLLLTCDCALLAADVLSHILKHFLCVLEDLHSQTIQSLEGRQLDLHTRMQIINENPFHSGDPGEDDVEAEQQAFTRARGAIDTEEIENHENDFETEQPRNMSSYEVQQESRRLDRRMEVLELAHNRRLSIMDSAMFALELLCHLLTVAHFSHIWTLHGVQFTLIDGVLALHLHSAISGAFKKIAQRRNVHSIVRDLHGLFPNASDQELQKASLAGDVCCICLGTMSTGGHVKKVHCGHLYHTHCLREVVERAQSIKDAKCPLCRASVLDGRRDESRTPPQPQPPQPPVGEQAQQAPPPPPVAGERALFRFSTEGIFPMWVPIPAFSFEVVRRPLAHLPPTPAPIPPLQEQQTLQRVQLDEPIPLDANERINDRELIPQQEEGVPDNVAQPSFLRRLLVLAGAIPMSPEEEAQALAQLVDMFPQYDRSDLLRELRERGSSEAVAEAVLMGIFSGIPRGD